MKSDTIRCLGGQSTLKDLMVSGAALCYNPGQVVVVWYALFRAEGTKCFK